MTVAQIEVPFLVGASEGADACSVKQLIELGSHPAYSRQRLKFSFRLTRTNNPNSPTFLVHVLIVRLMALQAAFRVFSIFAIINF